MNWLSPVFYMEAKLGPLEKGYIKTDIYIKIFRKQQGIHFGTTKGMKKF
jgi:hypothetical protein